MVDPPLRRPCRQFRLFLTTEQDAGLARPVPPRRTRQALMFVNISPCLRPHHAANVAAISAACFLASGNSGVDGDGVASLLHRSRLRAPAVSIGHRKAHIGVTDNPALDREAPAFSTSSDRSRAALGRGGRMTCRWNAGASSDSVGLSASSGGRSPCSYRIGGSLDGQRGRAPWLASWPRRFLGHCLDEALEESPGVGRKSGVGRPQAPRLGGWRAQGALCRGGR